MFISYSVVDNLVIYLFDFRSYKKLTVLFHSSQTLENSHCINSRYQQTDKLLWHKEYQYCTTTSSWQFRQNGKFVRSFFCTLLRFNAPEYIWPLRSVLVFLDSAWRKVVIQVCSHNHFSCSFSSHAHFCFCPRSWK